MEEMNVNNVVDEVKDKIEFAAETVSDISDAAQLQVDVNPNNSKGELIFKGILCVLGLLGVFKIIDLIKSAVRKHKAKKAEKKKALEAEDDSNLTKQEQEAAIGADVELVPEETAEPSKEASKKKK